MTGKVFISYSSADQPTADKLVAEIERRGIPCWISSRDIRPGEDYQGAIVAAMEASAVVLLLFSRHAEASAEIPRELGLASRFKKTVIPARLEDIVPSGSFAYQMTTAQFIDLFHDFESKVDGLCIRLAELLQSSAEVAQRISREQRRRGRNRKLTRFAAFTLIPLLLAATVWALRARLEGWLAGQMNPASPTAQAPAAPSEPAPLARNNPAPAVAPPAAPAALRPAAPAVLPPAAPAVLPPAATSPPANGALASRTYEGIRFDVMSVRTDGNSLKLLINATETQKRNVKLQFLSNSPANAAPQAIDDRGDTSTSYRAAGIPDCGDWLGRCAGRDAQWWSKLYPDSPLIMTLELSGPAAFAGSSVNVSFKVLLGIEPADGGSQQTTPIPVVFTNLPLKPGAAGLSALASRTYEGVRFDVMSVRADGDNLKLLINATDTQKRTAKLQFLSTSPANAAPQAIDDWGNTSKSYRAAGIPDCGDWLDRCAGRDAIWWSKLYPDNPIIIILQLSGPAAFAGSSVNVSFKVLLGIEPADGGSQQTISVPVVFTNLPLKPGAAGLSALASRTYEGIRFDVMSVRADGDNLKLLINATDTQKRTAKLQFSSTSPANAAPQAIDDRGVTSASYRVAGIPDCGDWLDRCAGRDAIWWSKLYPDNPIIIILQLSGPAAFAGSSVNVSFKVLLGIEPADGGSQQTISVPVVFTNLPLKPGSAGLSALASRTYEGVRFDVMSVRADGDNLKLLISATDTQKRDAKLQFFSNSNSNAAPQAIDDQGDTTKSYRVAGIPDCGDWLNRCSGRDAIWWSKLYPDNPIIIVLQLSGPAAFAGSSVNVSFSVLLSVQPDDGGSPSTKLIPASFARLALK